MAPHRQPGFRGRASECQVLDGLLETVRGGQSAGLVIRGEAGLGKTALLRYAAGQASGFRIVQLAGVEAEMELPFAGLHQLCASMVDHLPALPGPQQDALRVAFGLSFGDAPDPFLVGLGTLSLLSEAAAERPLVCFVDDAQWLDAATCQVLGFVARRLLGESVGLIFAVREPRDERGPTDERELVRLPELLLMGLNEDDAGALLAAIIPGRLDRLVRDRIIGETGGNPLALLELSRGITAAQLAGGFGASDGDGPAGSDRGPLSGPHPCFAGAHPAPDAPGRGRPCWRRFAPVAGRSVPRYRTVGGGARRGRPVAGDRRRCAVSPSAREVSGLPRRVDGRSAGRPPRPGHRHRSRG